MTLEIMNAPRQSVPTPAARWDDDFCTTLSHELRNRLAPMHHGLQLLRDAAGGRASVTAVAEVIQRQVTHMTHMVDRLLDFSRLEHGDTELKIEPVELDEIVHAAIGMVRPLLTPGGCVISVTLPPGIVTFSADRVRLTEVIANLLENAVRYSSETGGVRVSARIRHWKHKAFDELVLSVWDTGIGIPPTMLKNLFSTDGHRADPDERTYGGLGIGLRLVRRVVEMHGGSVEVHSEGAGFGSEFVVRLPLVPPTAATTWGGHREHLEFPALTLPARRILVVDDNTDAAETLAALLRKLGADVQVVFNGEDAINALRGRVPDVVLLDLGMPGMTGYDLASRVRGNPAFRDVVLVAMTGWDSDEVRSRSLQAGIDHHLVKPVEFDALQGLLNLRAEFIRPRSVDLRLV